MQRKKIAMKPHHSAGSTAVKESALGGWVPIVFVFLGISWGLMGYAIPAMLARIRRSTALRHAPHAKKDPMLLVWALHPVPSACRASMSWTILVLNAVL